MPMLVPATPSRPCRWRLGSMKPLRGASSTCLRPPPSTMETWKGSSWTRSTSPVPAAHPVTGRTKVERSQRACRLILFTQVCSLSPRRPQSPDQDEGQITFDVEMCSPRHSQVRRLPALPPQIKVLSAVFQFFSALSVSSQGRTVRNPPERTTRR